jgi:hypothetical protein
MTVYMKIELKDQYKNESFIKDLNHTLTKEYNGGEVPKFNPMYYLQKIVKEANSGTYGLDFIAHLPRPFTIEMITERVHWLRYGTYHASIGYNADVQEALGAIAVCRWIEDTAAVYIDIEMSTDYDRETLRKNLDRVLSESGIDPVLVWTGHYKHWY